MQCSTKSDFLILRGGGGGGGVSQPAIVSASLSPPSTDGSPSLCRLLYPSLCLAHVERCHLLSIPPMIINFGAVLKQRCLAKRNQNLIQTISLI